MGIAFVTETWPWDADGDLPMTAGGAHVGAPAYSGDPSSKWPFEQPHVARDLLARLYVTMGRVRDAKLEAEIDVFLAATRRP